jgi:hypothetical protein
MGVSLVPPVANRSSTKYAALSHANTISLGDAPNM